jgi:hypothetical protein
MQTLTSLAARMAIFVALCACAVAQNNPVPFVNQSLYPASIAPGSKAFTLIVAGTGFAPTAVVNWNGTPQLTEVISSSELKAPISAADVATAQTAWITVTNPAPGGGTSNLVFFPITEPYSTIGMAVSQAFPGATAVAVGDFNNDGKLDVAWVTTEGILNVSLGNGKGGFQAPIQNGSVTRDGVILNMVAADFNNDGNLDLAVATVGGFTVLLGNGEGTFTTSDVADPFYGGTTGMAVADFNQDGCLDIYVGGWQLDEAYFQIYAGNCKGVFSYSGEYATGFLAENDSSGITPGNPAIGDFNGDGYLDLAVGGQPNEGSNDGEIEIFLGDDGGYFTQSSTLSTYSVNTAAADVNKDGKLDLITDYGCVLLGNGDGTFNACNTLHGGEGEVADIADFNGDGNLDVATGSLVIDLGEGNGKFPKDFSFGLGSAFPAVPPGAMGDFNNDGKLDAVTVGGYLFIQTTVDLTPLTLNFGSVALGTTSTPQIATLNNVGASPLTIHGIGIVGTGSKNFSATNNCGASLAAGTTCTISITFAPKSGGIFTPVLGVSYEGTASPQTIALTGTGLTPPSVTLRPASLTFATQLAGTSSAPQTVTLTNTGGQTVNISGISASAPFTQTNSCPSSLPAGLNCQIEVVFTPTLAGTTVGTLSVADNATNSPQQVALSGMGTVMTFSPVSVNFGDQAVGTSSPTAPITVTNIGSTAVAISSIAVTGADPEDFTGSSNCGSTLSAKSSCTIKAKFTPTATGDRSAQVTISDGGGGSPQSVALTGTGT